VNDPVAAVPGPDPKRSAVRAGIRLIVLIVGFLLLPMLLLAAMIPPQGCGGG
jgi:hypothetical protein